MCFYFDLEACLRESICFQWQGYCITFFIAHMTQKRHVNYCHQFALAATSCLLSLSSVKSYISIFFETTTDQLKLNMIRIVSRKGYECIWTWEIIQHYTWTQLGGTFSNMYLSQCIWNLMWQAGWPDKRGYYK